MTIYYKEFDVDNFDVIQSKLVPYVLSIAQNYKNFWNHVDTNSLLTAIPELKTAIESIIGQTPMKSYILVVPNGPLHLLDTKLGEHSLHRDTSVEQYRLNWPILNGTSIETKFFTSDAEPHKLVLPTGETYLTYDEDQCTFETSNVITKPTIINTHAIHSLYRIGTEFPRIILSFNFANEITISND